MQQASSLEKYYDACLGSYLNIQQFDRGAVSPKYIFCSLIFHKFNECARVCHEQIQSAVKGAIDGNGFRGTEVKERTVYDLTPLHLAVIRGSYDLVQRLLKSGLADVNAKDSRHWTAMHHAALRGDSKMISLLSEHGGDATIFNHRLGTPNDLFRLCYPVKVDENKVLPLVVLKENGTQRSLSPAKFKEMTQAEFLEEYEVDPLVLLEDWKNNMLPRFTYPFFDHLNIDQWFSNYSKNPPKLALEKHSNVGFDVKTTTKLKKGEGVTEYMGEVVPSNIPIRNLDYALRNVDASQKRNLGPMINDGFPNTASIPRFIAGTERHFFFMLDDAEADKCLCWNYGSGHDVKFRIPHVELRKEAMVAFFQQYSLSQITAEIKNGFNNEAIRDSEALDLCSKWLKLGYLISTPTSLLRLLLMDVVTLKDFKALFNDEELQKIVNERPECISGYQKIMFPIIESFLTLLESWEKKQAPYYNEGRRQRLIDILDLMSLENILGFYQDCLADPTKLQ